MKSKRSTGSIVAIVGGIALVIGAFLTWATASFNVQAFASLLGVDASTLGGLIGDTSKSFSGLDAGADGKWALAMGLVAVALGVVLIAWKGAHKVVAVGIVLAGLVGGGYALYDITQVDNVKQDAIDQAAPALQGLGVDTSKLGDVFDISLGIGIWVCAFGGLIAIVGGVMVLASGDEEVTAPSASGMGPGVAMGSTMGSAMGTGSGTGMAPPPATPAPTMTPDSPAPPAEPSQPPAGGGETSPSDGGADETPGVG
jgi:hypothetical protein